MVRSCSIRSLTASTTIREFSPISIITRPVTASPRPSRVTAPCLTNGAISTVATSLTRIGVPAGVRCSTMSEMSLAFSSSACPRMNRCSS